LVATGSAHAQKTGRRFCSDEECSWRGVKAASAADAANVANLAPGLDNYGVPFYVDIIG